MVRVRTLCDRLRLPVSVSEMVFRVVEHVVTESVHLLFRRHLDQIILSATYGVCKVREKERGQGWGRGEGLGEREGDSSSECLVWGCRSNMLHVYVLFRRRLVYSSFFRLQGDRACFLRGSICYALTPTAPHSRAISFHCRHRR